MGFTMCCMTRAHNDNAKLTALAPASTSPFDQIRRTRSDQSEFWSARDLEPLMGYARWENFMAAVSRAKKTAENQGMEVDVLFLRSQEKTGGRPREDFELTRYAAYLVAMNGDPNIPAVASAQHYFAIRTREAEVCAELPGPAGSPIGAEIDAAIAQTRLLGAMRGIIDADELASYGRKLLDRHLAVNVRNLDAPLSPHQFLLDKGVSALDAETLLIAFCEAVAKAVRKLTARRPQEVAVLGKRVTRSAFEFTEADRPAMEVAWKAMGVATFAYPAFR